MRTVRPQGRTFRITQPHGLRVSYLGMHSGLYNRSNRMVTDIALVKDRRKTIDTAGPRTGDCRSCVGRDLAPSAAARSADAGARRSLPQVGSSTAMRTASGRSRAAQSSPLPFRRFGHAINTDELFGTHSGSSLESKHRCRLGGDCANLRPPRADDRRVAPNQSSKAPSIGEKLEMSPTDRLLMPLHR
jgi:hypothetical protein